MKENQKKTKKNIIKFRTVGFSCDEIQYFSTWNGLLQVYNTMYYFPPFFGQTHENSANTEKNTVANYIIWPTLCGIFGYFVSNLRGFSTFQNRKHQVQEQFSHWKHFPHWRCSWRCTKIASHVHWIYSVWFLRINHQRFNGAYFYSAVCVCALFLYSKFVFDKRMNI